MFGQVLATNLVCHAVRVGLLKVSAQGAGPALGVEGGSVFCKMAYLPTSANFWAAVLLGKLLLYLRTCSCAHGCRMRAERVHGIKGYAIGCVCETGVLVKVMRLVHVGPQAAHFWSRFLAAVN